MDHLTFLVDRSPQVPLFTLDIYEHFINEKCIAITHVPVPQTFGISGPKFVTPQTNGFIAYRNVPFSQQIFDFPMAHFKLMIDPHSILNDFRGKPVPFV